MGSKGIPSKILKEEGALGLGDLVVFSLFSIAVSVGVSVFLFIKKQNVLFFTMFCF